MQQKTFYDVAMTWMALTKPTIAYSTFEEYERVLNRYFFPKFQKSLIVNISYTELVLFLAELEVTAKTFNNVMIPLRGIFKYARKIGITNENIVDLIASRHHQKPVPDPLEPEEVFVLLNWLEANCEPVWRNYFTIAIFAGLRPSELIALHWESVDFKRLQLCIKQARVRARLKGTKTNRIRYVDLQTPAEKALLTQRKLSLAHDCVFINPATGRPFASTEAPLKIWHSALEGIGVRKRGAKQTRHTFATLCLHAQMNPTYVSRQMGHTSAKMFFEVYSRWIDGAANIREKAKMDTFLNSCC